MPLHVLLIQGMSIVEVDWYADELLKISPQLRSPTCKVTRVSYDHGENVEAVLAAMRRHDYNAIIVCDLSTEQNAFAIGLGSEIQKYVRSGGRVAFPTSEGLNLIPVLKELFEVPWTRAGYSRQDWVASPQSAALLTAQFPMENSQRVTDYKFCVKGCSYKNVPQSDRCFELAPYEEESDEDNEYSGASIANQESEVIVAVRSYGDGFVSYFGDVNCELPTAKLVGAFVTVPRNRSPSASNMERQVTRATQAKENGNKAFREGKFQHALSFYDEAQKLLEPVALSHEEERSKVMGNIAECRLRLGQWPQALEASSKALELDPSNVKAQYRRTRVYLAAAREDIKVLKKKRDIQASAISHLHDLSLKLCEDTLSQTGPKRESPTSHTGRQRLGLLSKSSAELRELGNEKFKAEMYDFAVSYYEAALLVGPSTADDRVKCLCNLSACHIRKENWQLAVKAADKALEINPSADKALLRRVKAQLRLGNLSNAKDDLETLRSLPDISIPELRSLSEQLKSAMGTAAEEEKPNSSPVYCATGTIPGLSMPLQTNFDPSQVKANQPANSWSNGLGQQKRHEWLVDCYRMRLDDLYTHTGDVRIGTLYDPEHSVESVMVDFLVFCKMGVANGALPSAWRWKDFLNEAKGHLCFAFEKSDAQEKYGEENYFNGLLGIGSGRSLRYTAQRIYGSEIMNPDEGNDMFDDMWEDVRSCLFEEEEEEEVDFEGTDYIFAEVGGKAVWQKFLQDLRNQTV